MHREIVKLKMTHINFVTLNSHVTVIYVRFIKSTYFYVVKLKNRKTVTIKLHLSEDLTTFQNLLENRKLKSLTERFGNISDFDKESKRKPLSHISRQFY